MKGIYKLINLQPVFILERLTLDTPTLSESSFKCYNVHGPSVILKIKCNMQMVAKTVEMV